MKEGFFVFFLFFTYGQNMIKKYESEDVNKCDYVFDKTCFNLKKGDFRIF